MPWLVFSRATNGKSNEHVMHRVLRCGSWWFRKQLSAVLGPNFASHLVALVLGQASQMESCMRSSMVLLASFFVVLSSSASDARPSRPSVAASECNVTMPCDLSVFQFRRGDLRHIRERFVARRLPMKELRPAVPRGSPRDIGIHACVIPPVFRTPTSELRHAPSGPWRLSGRSNDG